EIGKRIAVHYPAIVLAQFSTAFDLVQAGFYTLMGGFGLAWPVEMQKVLDRVSAGAPNFRYFVGPGKEHCATPADAFYAIKADGTRLRDWVDDLVNAL